MCTLFGLGVYTSSFPHKTMYVMYVNLEKTCKAAYYLLNDNFSACVLDRTEISLIKGMQDLFLMFAKM